MLPPYPLPRAVALGASEVNEVTLSSSADANAQLGFAISACVGLGIILWEYVTFLPDEIRLYRRPVWGTIPPYAFLALRYGGILASMPIVFLSAVRSHNCQLAASLSQAGVVVVIVASATIFTFRTAILWADNRIIRWSLGGLLIVMAGCWIAPATQYRALTGPTPPFGSTRKDSVVAHQIYRANLAYVLGTTITIAVVLVLKSLSPPSSALVLSARCIATVFTVAFGTRAFRNLVLASVFETETRTWHPLS
ncbi:hypothetical protein B0H14DRAFT_3870917 [Mycena olivaceomarginata]|nr:hypothetical protein B0H14DRAFT_3870917 [Mycena olivaceomarginata]